VWVDKRAGGKVRPGACKVSGKTWSWLPSLLDLRLPEVRSEGGSGHTSVIQPRTTAPARFFLRFFFFFLFVAAGKQERDVRAQGWDRGGAPPSHMGRSR